MKKDINVIFLIWRGYNDFDHLLPIIHSLSKSKKYKYNINVIFDHLSLFFNKKDLRVEYIKSLKNVYLNDTLNNKYKNLLKTYNFSNSNHLKSFFFRYLLKIYKSIIYRFILFKIKNIEKIKWDKILNFSLKNNKTLILTAHQAPRIISIVKYFKIINPNTAHCLLPHGVTLCENKMLDISSLSINFKGFDFSRWKNINHIFVPDNYLMKKAKVAGVSSKKLFHLGSPRFCKEWLDIKKDLELDGPTPSINNNKKKILFIMPNTISNIFFDEVIRTVYFISQYQDIDFLVQKRDDGVKIPQSLILDNNINWISNEYSTSALIDWSDCVIHSITSMHLECLQKNKIVIFPRYLMANTSICELYKVGIILKNRDELRETMNSIITDYDNFYKKYMLKSDIINKYLFDIVNANKNNVLDNYIDTIESLAF